MPASRSALARAALMCPIDAQRLRFVCSATSRAPSSTFSKSRLDSPWPWVTMQKRCAPAASAARACSRICSGSIIACIGVSASAKRDCAQNPQSSAQPPDLALTSEHMSVLSPKRSWRACHARSTSASIVGVVLELARAASASSRVMSGGMARKRRPRAGRRRYPRRAVAPIRVLVCDDAEAFRALMRYTLQEDPGIEVVGEAADGDGRHRRRRAPAARRRPARPHDADPRRHRRHPGRARSAPRARGSSP